MKAFIFPGQGSQKPGMGKELFDAFACARAVFEEVDDALDQKLSKLIFEGTAEELTLTENAQPALMAVSMAAMRVLEVEGKIDIAKAAAFVAGHSLGEYSALAAVRSLSLGDTARLLRLRGQAMQSAVPVGQGAMAALLGADMKLAEEIAAAATKGDEICVAANDNAPDQVVISGSKEAVERAIEIAKEKGVKRALLLPVSAPFHSPLMINAANKMASALANTNIIPPRVPVIANVTAKPTDQSEEIRSLLVQQVTGRVRWRETVEFMHKKNITEVLEIGAGKVLCGLVKRTAPDITTTAINTPEDIENFLKQAAA